MSCQTSSKKRIEMDKPYKVWLKYSSSNSKGCVLQVDLKYPTELYEMHND